MSVNYQHKLLTQPDSAKIAQQLAVIGDKTQHSVTNTAHLPIHLSDIIQLLNPSSNQKLAPELLI